MLAEFRAAIEWAAVKFENFIYGTKHGPASRTEHMKLNSYFSWEQNPCQKMVLY